ncbi:MAG: YqeG family HAD IIIA-type phosphatase [Actinomycetia bacterium]|nr:YqeG family HAD IIIA-type phosphatase [Actinomycetes bacterium]
MPTRLTLMPDIYLSSVLRIDQQFLSERRIRALLMDINNTLVPRSTNEPPPDVLAWISGLKLSGIRMCLVSNNWHRSIMAYAKAFDLPLVYRAVKPLPFALMAGKHIVRTPARQIAVVGDQLFTDMAGARLLGMQAILVKPQSTVEPPHTLLLRNVEKLLLRGVRAED